MFFLHPNGGWPSDFWTINSMDAFPKNPGISCSSPGLLEKLIKPIGSLAYSFFTATYQYFWEKNISGSGGSQRTSDRYGVSSSCFASSAQPMHTRNAWFLRKKQPQKRKRRCDMRANLRGRKYLGIQGTTFERVEDYGSIFGFLQNFRGFLSNASNWNAEGCLKGNDWIFDIHLFRARFLNVPDLSSSYIPTS